jgi:hypothetical protein
LAEFTPQAPVISAGAKLSHFLHALAWWHRPKVFDKFGAVDVPSAVFDQLQADHA